MSQSKWSSLKAPRNPSPPLRRAALTFDTSSPSDSDAPPPPKRIRPAPPSPPRAARTPSPPRPARTRTPTPDADAEADYMTLPLPTSSPTAPQTSLQRTQARRAAAALRAHPKPQRELEAAATARREAAQRTALDARNKGFRMLAAMGYAAGDGLGREGGRKEPIAVEVKAGRGGVGCGEGRRREMQREMQREVEEREKVRREVEEPREFRARMAKEAEGVRGERVWRGAMAAAENLHEEGGEGGEVPWRRVNVLWRGLARERQERGGERVRGVGRELWAARDDDGDEAKEPGADGLLEEVYDDDDDDAAAAAAADAELEAFNELTVEERLARVVQWMREEKAYCFWCKARYTDQQDLAESCPGVAEEDHE